MEKTEEILRRWTQGEAEPTAQEARALLAVELADARRAEVWGIDAENGLEKIAARSCLFQSLYADLVQSCPEFPRNSPQAMRMLWGLWLPLALELQSARDRLRRPLVQGILGVQGTGKSTLASLLRFILERLGYPTLSLSLDDLYKTYRDRQQLQQQDPRLRWRGPPGTHDIELGIELLDRARRAEFPLLVPRFDKSAYHGAGDRAAGEIAARAEIILFEGWFVGVQPIAETEIETAPPPIVTRADRTFARDNNQRLYAYLPLWQRLDRLLVLYPLDYRWSLPWRQEAEQSLRARGKTGMSDTQIEEFVKYFWRSLHPELFVKPLIGDGGKVDIAIEVNRDRSPAAIYRPDQNPIKLQENNSGAPLP